MPSLIAPCSNHYASINYRFNYVEIIISTNRISSFHHLKAVCMYECKEVNDAYTAHPPPLSKRDTAPKRGIILFSVSIRRVQTYKDRIGLCFIPSSGYRIAILFAI